MREQRMRFWIGSAISEGVAGAWVKGGPTTPLTLTFNDGSSIRLESGSFGRVIESTPHDVHVQLEGGTLETDIRSAGRTRWLFTAGPYRVRVTGTAFRMKWVAAEAALEVTVSRGAVVVEGIKNRVGGAPLGPGERLYLGDRDNRVASLGMPTAKDDSLPRVAGTGAPSAETSPATSERRAAAVETRERELLTFPRTVSQPDRDAAAQPPVKVSWRDLYEEGRYEEAMDSAAAQGFEALLGELDAGGLWALAESARYGFDIERARRALSVLRERFPTSGRSRTAAFLLGRLSVESAGSSDEGARWFTTYLDESPSGPLAEEAAGRVIDALLKAGRTADAKTAAKDYLQKYPSGTFAGLARSVGGE
jgi:TolA-binding protein